MPEKNAKSNKKGDVDSSHQRERMKRKIMMDNRIYASYEAREYAKRRADEVKSGLDSKFPSFVKPMTQSHVTIGFWLGLPRQFCKMHLPQEDTRFNLIDENLQTSSALYLAKKNGLSAGWRGFSISHGLVDGDAVVFHLVESTTFKVYIIKASDLSYAKGHNGKAKQQKISYQKVKWKPQQAHRSSKNATKLSSTSVGTEKPLLSEDSYEKGNHGIHQNTGHKVMSTNQKVRQEQGNCSVKVKQEVNLKLHVPTVADREQENVHLQCFESVRQKIRYCKGYSYEAREHTVLRAKELQSGLDSQFPSFIVPLEKNHVSEQFWLEFPTSFCEEYLPRENTKITLIDENLETFKTLFLLHRSGLTLGWQEFCISHKLSHGDVLIFHLASPTTFKVYILKAGGFPCAPLPTSENCSKKKVTRTTTHETQLRRSKRLSAKILAPCTSEVDNDKSTDAVDVEHLLENKGEEEAVISAEKDQVQSSSLHCGLKKDVKCRSFEAENPLCKICMEDTICMLLLPCKHLVLCKACEPKLHVCPICYCGKVSSVEVFLT